MDLEAVSGAPERALLGAPRGGSREYFFDIADGNERQDQIGTEYNSDSAARQEARRRALNFSHSHRLQTYNGFRHITVRDESGRIVCKVAIKPEVGR